MYIYRARAEPIPSPGGGSGIKWIPVHRGDGLSKFKFLTWSSVAQSVNISEI